MKNRFKFTGGAATYLGIGIVAFLLTACTFGIGFPWAICMKQNWIAENTYIDGKQLTFKGTGFGLIGKWIVWLLLIAVTVGIYSLWIMPKLQKWITENTHFKEDTI